MPFIISPSSNQYRKFKSLLQKYKNAISKDPTAHCLVGFTAASILRNDGSANLCSFESWLESLETKNVSQEEVKNDIVDQIIFTLDACQQYHQINLEDKKEEKADDTCIDKDMYKEDSFYDLKRYASRNPYSNHSYPVHDYQPKYSFMYE